MILVPIPDAGEAFALSILTEFAAPLATLSPTFENVGHPPGFTVDRGTEKSALFAAFAACAVVESSNAVRNSVASHGG